MILLCRFYQVKCILAAVYVTPPFITAVLRALLTYQLGNPETIDPSGGPLLCFRPRLEKKIPPMVGLRLPRTMLQTFIEEVGWVDPWHRRNPQQKQFSYFSKLHYSLSTIDLCVCTTTASLLIRAYKTWSEASQIIPPSSSTPERQAILNPTEGTVETKCLLVEPHYFP